jgi:O-antigen/teichoic acid export membrane protein
MVRNLIHLGLGQVTTTILTIVLSATMARMLGPSDFGLWFLVTTIATFAYVIVEWGHGPYIIRETARHPERAGELLGSAFALRSAAVLIVGALSVTATWLLGYDVRTRVLSGLLIVAMLPQFLGLSYGWVFRAHERMDRDAMLNVVLKLATLVGSIICLTLGGGLLVLAFVWCLAGCLTLVTGIIVYRRMHLPAFSVSSRTMRELVHDGAALFSMQVAVSVEPYINANILFNVATAAVVGWYGAAWNIAGTLIAPATILGTSMYPRLSMVAGDPAEFKRVFDVSFRPLFLLAVLGCVGTFLFADVAIGLIYSLQKFGPAADTLRAYAPALLLIYVDFFLGTVILALGKARPLAGIKVVAVALTTGLVFVLVPLAQARLGNGGIGVMSSIAIGEVVMLLPICLLLRGVIDRHTVADVIRSLFAGACTIFAIRLLPDMTAFLAIPLCVMLFGGLSLAVGAVKRTDIQMLLGSFRKT